MKQGPGCTNLSSCNIQGYETQHRFGFKGSYNSTRAKQQHREPFLVLDWKVYIIFLKFSTCDEKNAMTFVSVCIHVVIRQLAISIPHLCEFLIAAIRD